MRGWARRNPEKVRAHTLKTRAAKIAYFRALKLERGCADCGGAWQASVGENPDALQFDHVPGRGEKLFNVSARLSSNGWADVLAELEKCDVVCANCHAVRSADRSRAHMAPTVG